MKICVSSDKLFGEIKAISSKSVVHRLLIAAALAENNVDIYYNQLSEDILATANCLKAMGFEINVYDDFISVGALKNLKTNPILDACESGSTARFLLPLATHLFENFTMIGKGKLPNRPFGVYVRELSRFGCEFSGEKLPMTVKTEKLKSGEFFIEGDISSQFISGLMFCLPLLEGDSKITLTSPLESAAYVDITLNVLEKFNIKIEKTETGFFIKGGQKYKSESKITAEGDWSNSAFFLCMGALSGDVCVSGLNENSAQGDKEIISLLKRFGAKTSQNSAALKSLNAIEIDASQIPDLVPVLAVVASVSKGQTKIFNAERLKIKESDRIKSTFDMLSALGADIKMTNDGFIINGKEKLNGGTVDSAGDHRIVMSASVASCVCENSVIINGFEAVNKSYPSFFSEFKKIGGESYVI